MRQGAAIYEGNNEVTQEDGKPFLRRTAFDSDSCGRCHHAGPSGTGVAGNPDADSNSDGNSAGNHTAR